MKTRIAPFVAATALAVAIVGVLQVNSASAAVVTYSATLLGTNENPSNGSGYTGSASITVNTTTFQVCVQATTTIPGSDPIILDHIHSGAAGTNGPVVVDFMNDLTTCVTSNQATVDAIVANPSAFYFNVHTSMFTGGAIRGQLQLVTASSSSSSSTSSSRSSSTTTSTRRTTGTVSSVAAVPAFTG